jgi:hypothetical protein
MNGIFLLVAGLGIVFLASTIQTYGTNWLGQECPFPGPCFHPAWLAIGVSLSAAAWIGWLAMRRPPPRNPRDRRPNARK